METSLHRQLKEIYAEGDAQLEKRLAGYRIDVLRNNRIIEIQHGSLSAIRRKVQSLIDRHRVLVVKPIIARKLLVQLDVESGKVLRRRRSPKQGSLLDIFDELVHFTPPFPHHQLELEVLLVDIEEWRYPGHGRRHRYHKSDFQVKDRKLVKIAGSYLIRTATDIRRLVSGPLPRTFHTRDLACCMKIDRGVAQKIAYCLRRSGAITQVGKKGNTRLYTFAKAAIVA